MDTVEDETNRSRLADDLLIGASAIANETGFTESQVYYLAKTRKLPIGRMGKCLIALRSKLRGAAKALVSTPPPTA